MTQGERAYFARMTAANAEAVKHRIQEAEERKEIAVKTETVKKILTTSRLTLEDIANFSNTSVDFVLAIRQNF
jgi:hypothetical protein